MSKKKNNTKARPKSPSKGSKPVTDLQPYLDTYAHLTAFHEGDAAFAHLHPTTKVTGDHGGPEAAHDPPHHVVVGDQVQHGDHQDGHRLLKVDQLGPACHTGAPTCFFRKAE